MNGRKWPLDGPLGACERPKEATKSFGGDAGSGSGPEKMGERRTKPAPGSARGAPPRAEPPMNGPAQLFWSAGRRRLIIGGHSAPAGASEPPIGMRPAVGIRSALVGPPAPAEPVAGEGPLSRRLDPAAPLHRPPLSAGYCLLSGATES